MLETGELLRREIPKVEARLRSRLSMHNSGLLDAFITQLRLRECKPQSIQRALYALEPFMTNYKCDLDKLPMQELQGFICSLNARPGSEWTKNNVKKSVKLFYKLLWGEEAVSWIRIRQRGIESVKASDLVTIEEVQRLLDACETLRDKAMLMVLWDAGIRPGELFGMRVRDVNLEACEITVDGKTGERTIPLAYGSEMLRRYIQSTSRLDDSNAYLWYWRSKRMGQTGLKRRLERIGKKAKVGKRVYPYVFRHTAATRDSKIYTEPILRYKYGWKKDSRMPAVYIHLGGSDLREVTANNREMFPKLMIEE